MKKISFLLLSFVLICVTSCKKDTVDVTDLLKTVPSSAAGVIVFNLENLLEDAGCKIKGHDIIPSEEVKKAVSGKKELVMNLFDGNNGIEPKGAVMFFDSKRTFLTFALYDVDMFCKLIEKEEKVTFSDMGSGVKVGGNIAVKGAQAWVCLSSGKTIDSDAISNYASLASSQSFLVTPMGEKLLTEEDDVRGWAMVNTFSQQILSRRDQGMFTLGLGFLFEGAESIKFKVDFKKGEAEAEAIILNDKGKPAKYQLPSDKVDVQTLKSLGSTCDALMAFTVSPKLIKKFEQIGSAFGGALFGDLGDTFKNVDGTVGIAAGGTGLDESINGFITTKGDVTQTLKDMISEYMGAISMDGKLMRFTKGDVKGSLNVEESAEELKGSCMGIVVDATGYGSLGYGDSSAPAGFKNFVIKLKPESGGLEFEFEAKTADPKENALVTLLK